MAEGVIDHVSLTVRVSRSRVWIFDEPRLPELGLPYWADAAIELIFEGDEFIEAKYHRS